MNRFLLRSRLGNFPEPAAGHSLEKERRNAYPTFSGLIQKFGFKSKKPLYSDSLGSHFSSSMQTHLSREAPTPTPLPQ